MQPDLRSHLALLERHGKLVRVPRPVDPGTELAALIIEAERRRQAVLFESVRGSAMPCVANVVGDRAMVGLGLGVPPEAAVGAFLERSRRRLPPVVVTGRPGAGGRAHRRRRGPPAAAAHRPRRAGRRPLLHGGARDRARSGNGQPEHLVQPHDAPRPGRGRHPDDAAPAPRPDLRARRPPAARTCPWPWRSATIPPSSSRAPPPWPSATTSWGWPARSGASRPSWPVRVDRPRGAGPSGDRAGGRGPGRRRRAGRALRRLHAVLRPGHAQPRSPSHRHHASAGCDPPDHACGTGGGHHAARAVAGGAAPRGRRRVRRRRSPGEPAPHDPGRRHQHPKAVRGRAQAGPRRGLRPLSLAQALHGRRRGRRRPGCEATCGGPSPPAAGSARACSTSRTPPGFPRDPHGLHTAKLGIDATIPLGAWTSTSASARRARGGSGWRTFSRAETVRYGGAAPDAVVDK